MDGKGVEVEDVVDKAIVEEGTASISIFVEEVSSFRDTPDSVVGRLWDDFVEVSGAEMISDTGDTFLMPSFF